MFDFPELYCKLMQPAVDFPNELFKGCISHTAQWKFYFVLLDILHNMNVRFAAIIKGIKSQFQ